VVGAAYEVVEATYPGLDPYRRRHEALRRVFGEMVGDVIETSRANLEDAKPESAEALRHLGRPVIRFSPVMWADLRDIRAFLFKRMYRAPKVIEMRREVTSVVEELFPFYMAKPDFLPERWQAEVARATSETALARLVCDYISGMTDRFALEAHARLIGEGRAPVGRRGI
jgi:dGTPase